LNLDYSPDPSDIFPVDTANIYPHWVVTATEFQINSYDFHFWDNNEDCAWDSINWAFENPNVQWMLQPDSTTRPVGKRCKMFVLNYVEDTVWLRATAYNHCNPQGKSQRYWFICSFYGIDDPSTESGGFNVDVMPNPNKGEMSIGFGETEGMVNVTVYDMLGQTIDRFSLNTMPHSRHSYNLEGQKSGIYLFVFNFNGNAISKKIVITK
jgi:hypothetical protein